MGTGVTERVLFVDALVDGLSVVVPEASVEARDVGEIVSAMDSVDERLMEAEGTADALRVKMGDTDVVIDTDPDGLEIGDGVPVELREGEGVADVDFDVVDDADVVRDSNGDGDDDFFVEGVVVTDGRRPLVEGTRVAEIVTDVETQDEALAKGD